MNLEKKEIKNEPSIRFLEVRWNDLTVGYLMKEYGRGYIFKYNYKAVLEAKKQGFSNIICFPKLNRYYASPVLWEIFRCRIPKGSRRDLEEMLNRYGVKYIKNSDGTIKFDDFDYLAASHGDLMTDPYSLTEVDFLNKGREYQTKFTSILSSNSYSANNNNSREAR